MPARRFFRFFGGKGGVGKTTCAAAAAVAAAEGGAAVLVVSTDPAHSLGDALDQALGPEPTEVRVAGGGRLLAAEVAGPDAYRRWLDARRQDLVAIAERGSLLTREQAERLLALPPPGADELIGLSEVVRVAAAVDCRQVVVDTAPTGHTLRLLGSPRVLRRLAALLTAIDERHRVLADAFGGRTEAAPEVLTRLEEDARSLEALLRDPRESAFVWVSLPEALAVEEARHAFEALAEQGVPLAEVVVNRWSPERPGGGRSRRAEAEAAAVAALAALAPGVPFRTVPEQPVEPRGVASLGRLGSALAAPPRDGDELAAGWAGAAAPAPAAAPTAVDRPGSPPADWLAALVPAGLTLLFVGGKGGVGKTTCAATLALWAAAEVPRRAVQVVSIDPAHSLGDVLGQRLGDEPQPIVASTGDLTARELDAPRAWRRLRQRFAGELERMLAWGDRRAGGEATLDRAVLERLLESPPPGIDELVALAELAEAAAAAPPDGGAAPLLIVDTAPTGHALRLLEMPGLVLAWVQTTMSILLDLREAVGLGALAEELVALSRRLRAFQDLLGHPERCRFLLVSRAGELPRRESERLVEALDRLGVALAGVVEVGGEGADGAALAARSARRRCDMLLAPAVSPPPRGAAELLAWGGAWRCRSPGDAPPAGQAGAAAR